MCLHTHKGLQRTLRKRLPHIDRWRSISVYKWDSNRLPWYVDPEEGMVYMVWSRPKRGNIHDVEIKEFPLTDLDIIWTRNNNRLKNKTKAHK